MIVNIGGNIYVAQAQFLFAVPCVFFDRTEFKAR